MVNVQKPYNHQLAQSYTMPDDLISVIDLAAQCGKRKSTIFKVLRRLEIEAIKLCSAPNGGQLISYITEEEAKLVIEKLTSEVPAEISDEEQLEQPSEGRPEQGVFYLLLLEPEHDPGRFKVGFAVSLPERLRQLRCSAPFATVVRSWPCKSLWEKTAIECVSAGCERLHTEVFRTSSLETVVARCEQFFALMPSLSKASESSKAVDL